MHQNSLIERPTITRKWIIRKFNSQDGLTSEQVAAEYFRAIENNPANDPYYKPFEVVEINHNLLLNEGIAEVLDLIGGIGGTAFSNANAYIGVGDSSTAANSSQTGLQAVTNKLYKAMEASYPQRSAQTITWRAIFASGEANFAWNEFTVSNGNSDAADNLNRRVSAQGTKAAGQSWTLDMQFTLA